MTNQDKWRLYTSGLSSPENYISWGWIATVASSLQRRVWVGPIHQPCYANCYIILVGPPGVGKGLVIKEVISLLKHWKKKDTIPLGGLNGSATKEQINTAEMTASMELEKAQEAELQGKSKGADMIEPLLIPVAADATTYEALVKAVADAYSRCNYIELDAKTQTNKLKIYGHSSLCFLLQELSSLLRKRTDDTVNYMLGLYDCPTDYEYITITRGKDRVRRGCLNILAGTTPSFMQSTFDEKLMDEGFSSRTFYIYAQRNRKNQFWIPPMTPEQLQCREEILQHIRKLTSLYGSVKISRETEIMLQDWWNDQEQHKDTRINKSLKMVPYYARKNIHVMKVAMAMHFGESLEMEIPTETFRKAIAFLAEEEKTMHLALMLEGNSPASKATKRVLNYLETGAKNFVDLLIEVRSITDTEGLNEVIEFLTMTKQIKSIQKEDEVTKENITYWVIKTGEQI